MTAITYYAIGLVTIPDNPYTFSSSAIMSCLICHETISGHGGPGNAICISCGDKILERRVESITFGKLLYQGEPE